MLCKVGAMTEKACLPKPTKYKSLDYGTHNMPSLPELMGCADVTGERQHLELDQNRLEPTQLMKQRCCIALQEPHVTACASAFCTS